MRVGFIGMGTMGAAMANNVLKAGHDLTVFNRTKGSEEPLAQAGAACAASISHCAQGAEVVVVCVSDTPDVEEVILGKNGVIHGAAAGTVVVDCSTISPRATREIGAALSEKGMGMIDAPVSGGSEGARLGTLSIMVGGDEKDVAKARPVLAAMGRTITHIGPLGSGQLTKAINQIVCAGNYLAAAEGLALGLKAGLDMDQVLAAIRGGAAQSWVLDKRADNMIQDHYPLGFRVRLHRKDLGIALETAQEAGVVLPMTGLVAQLENGLLARGYGDEDLSALMRSLRMLSGI